MNDIYSIYETKNWNSCDAQRFYGENSQTHGFLAVKDLSASTDKTEIWFDEVFCNIYDLMQCETFYEHSKQRFYMAYLFCVFHFADEPVIRISISEVQIFVWIVYNPAK